MMAAHDHYYSEEQHAPAQEKEFICALRGTTFTFKSASGTFAKYRVDAGTRLLAETARVARGARVLDLGCGVGIIGIVLARAAGAEVTMTDTNSRAVRLARENAALNGVKARVLRGSLYAPVHGERFDAIVVNPPMAAGREVCYAIIDGATGHLVPGGTLQMVARHSKGGEMLQKRMEERFGSCSTLAKSGGFRVYCAGLKE